MPIRKDLRVFYGRDWYHRVRPRILRRAGGHFTKAGRYLGGAHCEQCGKPDRKKVFTFTERAVTAESASPQDLLPVMFWLDPGEGAWRDHHGLPFPLLRLKILPRKIFNILSIAHLNHRSGDDRDENLMAYCAWCHLHHDAVHHRDTRARRKDAERPLLAAAIQ